METTYDRKGTQGIIHKRECRGNKKEGTGERSVLDILAAYSPPSLSEKKEKK